MRRIALVIVAVGLLVGAAASSSIRSVSRALLVKQEERNPWNHLQLNNDADDFQFAIVSDRTGGHREKVFSLAVEQLNLLQPEFVMSVGDLIEGYSEDQARLANDWRDFQSYVARLQMPFFYAPGNHDLANLTEEKLWQEKFGRRYYHFVYKNVLFMVLSSEDPPGANSGRISEDQIKYVKQTLDENVAVRWTFVFVHKPMWVTGDPEKTGWLEVEKLLANRNHNVFAGHVHRYQKFIRNGHAYYMLATTGGASRMRGPQYGEFDHIVWVTMKKEAPVMANILLDGIYPEDMQRPVTVEPGVPVYNRKPPQPARGFVYLDGCALSGAYVGLETADPKEKVKVHADAMTEGDGSFVLSTYQANDGIPVGEYNVTVTWRKPLYTVEGKPGPNRLPEKYAKAETSGLKATVKPGKNELMFELQK